LDHLDMKRYGKIFEVTETVRLPKNLHSIENISNTILLIDGDDGKYIYGSRDNKKGQLGLGEYVEGTSVFKRTEKLLKYLIDTSLYTSAMSTIKKSSFMENPEGI